MSNIKWNGYGWLIAAGRQVTAHRYSYALHYGPIPEGMYVCHRCDVKSCINPAHLWLGTALDNVRDMVAKGRRVQSTAKLTRAQVMEIWQRLCSGETGYALAEEYGVTDSSIYNIRNGDSWTDVTGHSRSRSGGSAKTTADGARVPPLDAILSSGDPSL